MVFLKISDEGLRSRLKKPQGRLLKSFSEALSWAKAARSTGVIVASVGDRATINFISNDFTPDLSIVDGKELRERAPEIRVSLFRKVYEVENPAGTINMDVKSIISESIRFKPALIKVKGEEDLLTILLCVTLAPNSVVFYGQPGMGVVMVKLDDEGRKRFKQIFNEILELNKGELNA